MKFRKKPMVVEAMQFTGKNATEIISWAHEGLPAMANSIVFRDPVSNHLISIRTMEGIMLATPGDWIIKGIEGEFYPCKPGIFDRTYEKEGK